MKQIVRAIIAALALVAAPALAQQFPQTMPSQSVYGRLGITAGPGQAIPITLFKSTLTGSETPINDANYTALTTDSIIVYTALTAARTVTLPAASSVASGTQILLFDRSGKASNAINLSIAPTGGDFINGYNQSTVVISAPWQGTRIESDGASHWTATKPALVRNQLTAAQSYYVNGNSGATAACGPTGGSTCSAGSDTNDCLTPGTACLTTQHVVDLVIFKTDVAGFSATIYLAHGTSQNYAFTCEEGPLVGQSVFSVQGDGNSTTAVTIKAAPHSGSNAAISVKDGCTVGVANVAFADNGTNNASSFINVGTGGPGHVDLTNVTFGSCSICTALAVTYMGTATLIGSNAVTGSENALLSAGGTGVIDVAGTVAGSSSITWGTAAVVIQQGGVVLDVTGSTFTGFASVSGPRCLMTSVSSPDLTNPNSVFPGSTDCIVQFYVGALGLQTGSGGSSSITYGTSGQFLTSGGSSGKNTYDNIASHLTAGTNVSITGTTNATIGMTSASTTVAGQTCTLGSTCGLSSFTAQLSGDVSLSNTGNYFDGPSVAQGSTGTWLATGTVTLNSSTTDQFRCKLWDGTTVIAASVGFVISGDGGGNLALSGILASPAGNLRISCRDISSTNGTIAANASANSNKDSTITAIRIN